VSSGVARKVDQLGRVVLPAELRRQLDIREGDLVEFSVDGRGIVMAKVARRCVFCGGTEPGTELREFAQQLVCEPCVVKLNASGG
jgi:AbrB family transcriptional regulator, transcriptional pleiotropic regulator of transition state genes